MEYYSAKKGNQVLIHAITWVNLENIMLNERSQTKMSDIEQFNVCILNIQSKQIHKDRKEQVLIARGQEEGIWEVIVDEYKVSFWCGKNVLELMVMIAQLCEYTVTY